jgi:ribosomal protein S16
MELKQAKVRAFQAEEVPSLLSMNAIAKTIKALQTFMVNERENIQLSLELKEAQKEKGANPSEKVAKAI